MTLRQPFKRCQFRQTNVWEMRVDMLFACRLSFREAIFVYSVVATTSYSLEYAISLLQVP